jgi:ATP-dependent Clp protease protease subunit
MPRFIQDTPRGRMEWDPYSRLANDRIIFMGTPVDDTVANLIIAQLLILESEDPDKDVVMYINSPGGEITGLFAIYDTMQYIKPDVQTICIGQAASAAAVLLASGAPGKRFILPHARVLIHQPHGGASGQAVDIEIQAREITRMRELLDEILAFHTGQPVERVKKDTDRDFIMSAADAADYGLRWRSSETAAICSSARSAARVRSRSRSSSPVPACTSATSASISATRSSKKSSRRAPKSASTISRSRGRSTAT